MKKIIENNLEVDFINDEKIIDAISKSSKGKAKKAFYAINNGEKVNIFNKFKEGEIEVVFDEERVCQKTINRSVAYKISKLLKSKGLFKTIINLEVNEDYFIIDGEVENNITELDLNRALKKFDEVILDSNDLVNTNDLVVNQAKLYKIVALSGLTLDTKANRIKGFGGISQERFNKLIELIKEREERDHRKIGKELEIFMIDEISGKGLPIWLPNGVLLKTKIKEFIQQQEKKYGYIQVETPVLGSLDFYKTSGHYDHYKDSMFPIMDLGENEKYLLRPMACPHHSLIFKHSPKSYRDLPYRVAEQVHQYRYEASGALLGLERVRAMELTDSHIFLRMDQLKEELASVYDLVKTTLDKFNIEIKYLELALHDPKDKEKYHGNSEIWAKSENTLREFMTEAGLEFEEKEGEAAFYGPKIDIQIESALGHIITVSTIQLDFFLPERFDLTFINNKGENERVIMIHRGLIGTYERFISVLLEQTKGNLPMWLAPKQAVILPIKNELHLEYAQKINDFLKANDIRSEIDDSNERMNYKIRKHQTAKTKLQIIIGDEEIKNQTITYRKYGETTDTTIGLEDILPLFDDNN